MFRPITVWGRQDTVGLHGRDRIRRQPAAAVADCIDMHFDFVEQGEQEIRHWRSGIACDVLSGSNASAESADECAWQVRVAMEIAITHAATVKQQAVVEQGTVAVGCGSHLCGEVRE